MRHTDSNRLMPHDLDAERGVLGAILVNNSGFDQILDTLQPEHFFREGHRRIFQRMIALSGRNQPIDLLTLKDELFRTGDLEEAGGPAYISALTDGVPLS